MQKSEKIEARWKIEVERARAEQCQLFNGRQVRKCNERQTVKRSESVEGLESGVSRAVIRSLIYSRSHIHSPTQKVTCIREC